MQNIGSKSVSSAGALVRAGMALPLAFYFSFIAGAYASGYGLKEMSATSLGEAYAGSSATSADATYMSYNPASLSGVDSYDSSFSLIGLFLASDASYPTAQTSALTAAGGNATPSDFVLDAYIPNISARMRLSPQWSAGLAIYVPWGLSTDYPTGWAGRYYADKSRLAVLDIQPTLSFEPAPGFALGVGLLVQYAKGTLSNAVDLGTIGALYSVPGSLPGMQDGTVAFTADDWDVGFTAGVTAELLDGVTGGISYRSAVTHKMTGPLDFTLDSDGIGETIMGATGLLADTNASTVLTTPDVIYMGLRADLSDQWSVLAEADWTNWSRFQELRVDSVNPVQPDDVTDARWQDSWFGSVGLEFHPDESWTWRAGVGIDEGPVRIETRSPRIPDGTRTYLSAGFTYRATETFDVSLSYAHLFVDGGNLNLLASSPSNALRGNLIGRSEASAEIVGVQLNYHMPN